MSQKTVALFGSARIEPGSDLYLQTVDSAALLAREGWRISTGGGPGLMEAANKGAAETCEGSTCSLGYSIYLPFEASTNEFVQQETHHKTFFTRLDQFTEECDAFIALPGGWGTLLEVLIVVQLLQVGHIKNKPLILVGSAWESILLRADEILKHQGVVGRDEGPFWHLTSSPISAAKLLLELDASDSIGSENASLLEGKTSCDIPRHVHAEGVQSEAGRDEAPAQRTMGRRAIRRANLSRTCAKGGRSRRR